MKALRFEMNQHRTMNKLENLLYLGMVGLYVDRHSINKREVLRQDELVWVRKFEKAATGLSQWS